MDWDGISHYTGLGNGPLALISCPLARTAREYARTTSGRRLIFLPYHEAQQIRSTRSVMKDVVESGSLRDRTPKTGVILDRYKIPFSVFGFVRPEVYW